MIYPAIDLMNGKAVQLVQGKEKKLELENIQELVKDFSFYGELHVIDLDNALGNGENTALLNQILNQCNARVGGGIRSIADAKKLIDRGASKVIIGTKADQTFLEELCQAIGREKIIVALDSCEGKVVTEGWQKKTSSTPIERAKELENYCSEFLFTCVDYEGKMQGVDWQTINALKQATKNKLTVAGGVSSIEEIRQLEEQGIDSVLGMSLYTGKINLDNALIESLKFKNGLIPTIVQEANSKQVLMLTYSTKESIKQALQEKRGVYFSRRRQEIWRKGDTSGNTQKLVGVRADCDNDTLLFLVEQENAACHTGQYSCFGVKDLNASFLNELLRVLEQRREQMPKGSYTAKLLNDPQLLIAKLKEELDEVIEAELKQDKENLVWEIADLLYFTSVLAVKNGLNEKQVFTELKRRMK